MVCSHWKKRTVLVTKDFSSYLCLKNDQLIDHFSHNYLNSKISYLFQHCNKVMATEWQQSSKDQKNVAAETRLVIPEENTEWNM